MKTLPATRLILLILALALPASPTVAGELSAVINGKSFHLNSARDWNEVNTGLGLEYEFAGRSRWKSRLMASGFSDSNEQMSYVVGGGLHRNLITTGSLAGFYVDAGINAFVMTRQDVNNNQPFPGVLPSLTVGNRHVGVNVTYMPRLAVEKYLNAGMRDDAVSGIVFLQLKINLSPRTESD